MTLAPPGVADTTRPEPVDAEDGGVVAQLAAGRGNRARLRGATLAVKGVPEVRVLIATGVLVARLALYVVLGADDAVEIIHLEIDDQRWAKFSGRERMPHS